MESSIDREKVIKGLEHCANEADCRGCVYQEQMKGRSDGCDCMREVLTLLKEQEAVQVIQRELMHMLFWCCGSCGTAITNGDKFCRNCGKAVKWK